MTRPVAASGVGLDQESYIPPPARALLCANGQQQPWRVPSRAVGAERKHAPARVAIGVLTADDDAFVERMMLLAGFAPHIDLPRDARQMDHVRRFLDGWAIELLKVGG